MQQIDFYQVDAFTDTVFQGNPAGVCILKGTLSAEMMQNIAAENNLSETAFIFPENQHISIRYFSPKAEVDLCGHATLASAFVLSTFLRKGETLFSFETKKSGIITVERCGDIFALNLPADILQPAEDKRKMAGRVLGQQPQKVFEGRTDLLAVFTNVSEIQALKPDFATIAQWNYRGIIATAPGKTVDFVSRFFAPAIGIDEDPVTGSAHTTLVPYWAEKLAKNTFTAEQLSPRGGSLFCKHLNNRTEVAGKAVIYMHGHIYM